MHFIWEGKEKIRVKLKLYVALRFDDASTSHVVHSESCDYRAARTDALHMRLHSFRVNTTKNPLN